MSTLTVKFDTRQVEHALDATQKFVRTGTRQARPLVRRLLTRVENAAVDKAPVATGALRRSEIGEIIESGPAEAKARVSFSGLASKYAAVQHDRVDFRHTLPAGMSRTHRRNGKRRARPIKGYRGGQAKFLYGAPSSAWNQQEAAHWGRLLQQDLARIAERDINP